MTWTQVKAAMLLTAILTAAVMAFIARGQKAEVVRLKAFADSVQAAGFVRDSLATAEALRMARQVDSLQSTKAADNAKIRASMADRERLRLTLAAGLATAHDTILVQDSIIASQDSIITGLEANAKADSVSLWIAMRRGDAALDSLHAQTAALAALNARIQRLNQSSLPKWLTVSYEVAEKGLAAYGLVTLVRGK